MSAHILLVEASRVNQMLATKILEKGGYKIEVASNGKEAISKFECGEFDLILMDMELSDMDWVDAVRIIRQHQTTKEIPIIALTAHSNQDYREKYVNLGIVDFLTKPIRPEQIIPIIKKLLGHYLETLQDNADTTIYIDKDIFDLVPSYLKNCRECLAEMKEAVAKESFWELQRIGHNFKGSGGGYGFDEITRLGTIIEDNAKILNLPEIKHAIVQMENYLNQVKFISK